MIEFTLEELDYEASFSEFLEDEEDPRLRAHLELTLRFIRELRKARAKRDALEAAAREAQPHICSLLCPSTKREVEEWQHSELCKKLRALLSKEVPDA